MNDQPNLADMRTYAIALHELYMSYVKAGFNRDQAFELTRTVLAENIAANPASPNE